jgi:RimJ/RimL family protein N-acetyltransferase
MASSFHTQRLYLQLRDECDAAWNHELLGEHEGGTTASVQDVRLRLAEQRIEALSSGIGLFTIRRRADDEPLGYCGLIVGRCSLDEPEIAYELLKRFHGHGYATEAAHAVMDSAFTTGRNRIWSTVGAWNEPSLRVLDKLGFRRDHETIDDHGRVVYLVRHAPRREPALTGRGPTAAPAQQSISRHKSTSSGNQNRSRPPH